MVQSLYEMFVLGISARESEATFKREDLSAGTFPDPDINMCGCGGS